MKCAKFPSKSAPSKTARIIEIVKYADYLRDIRDSGFGIDKSIPASAFEAVIALDKYDRMFRDSLAQETLETLLTLKSAFTKPQ